MTTRMPDFAGSWYPADKAECLAQLAQFEAQAISHRGHGKPLVGGLVPHAGWTFSGGLAYNTVRELARSAGGGEGDGDGPPTVVLFGGHLGSRGKAGILTHGQVWTPLGEISTDGELAGALAERFTLVKYGPRDHPQDNTVELQFPLIRHLMPEARLVVILAPANGETLALAEGVVEEAAKLERRIQVIGSTDLTHYGPNYGWAPKGRGEAAQRWVREENDRRLINRALVMDDLGLVEEALASKNACCPGAASAAIRSAKKMGATEGHLLSYATSSDVHPSDSLVGYASLVF